MGRKMRQTTINNQRKRMTAESSKTLKKTSPTDKEPSMTDKVFNDPIHGTVLLHPLLVRMIDTPQFQRLRYIKQLGGVYFVYPGASHNRFEHSIGVAHLAGELVKALQTRQPDLKITDRDVLCVQIAGLCDDLGHGPFSHPFEWFINKKRPGWKHEEASLLMFDRLVECNKLKGVMNTYGLDTDEEHELELSRDVTFIKEMIKGQPLEGCSTFEGRPDKLFLYEIVANKRNGIDVNTFDYLARDAHHLGIKASFDHLRFIHFARVCEVEGILQICTRDQEVNNLYDLFHLRYLLHRRAYQHKVNKIIESMILEAFVKADQHIQIEGSGGRMFTLSTAIDDMEAYTKLTDDVFGQILHSSNTKLAEAKKILERIVTRQHSRFLGEMKATEAMITEMKSNGVEEMKRRMEVDLAKAHNPLTADDFDVHIVKMEYGMKDQDPINQIFFYSKRNPRIVPLSNNQKSKFESTCSSEQLIRVYCKKIDEKSVNNALDHMLIWCQEKGWPTPEMQ